MLTNDELFAILDKSLIIEHDQLVQIQALAQQDQISLYRAICDSGKVNDETLGQAIATGLNLPFISLSKETIAQDVFHIVPSRIARKYKITVFARDPNGIKLATSDPKNIPLFEMLVKKTNSKISLYYATERDIDDAITLYKKVLQKTIDELLSEEIEKARLTKSDDLPIAKIVDELIRAAYEDKTSDIHIEPEEKNSLVRFRIDGVLHDVLQIPIELHDRIITRIKVLSNLRTDEHMSAQDGKMRFNADADELDIRISLLPVVNGEKAVLRLLASGSRTYTLSETGMTDADVAKVRRAYGKSFGMILSTGPTGSGKTTSIYSILRILNTRERNIQTIEDPVEYRIRGANQVQVNVKANLTFANGLRSILRQDPNVIFVGEIRDSETAGIAVNAALTGHLVLSTLHTNDAATALPRLTDMKVEPFLVASTVNSIIAQRLVRKICDMCRTKLDIPRSDLEKNFSNITLTKHFADDQTISLFKGAGCKICRNTGYQGRLGIYEVLEVTNEIRSLIANKIDAETISKKAIESGMNTMIDDGLEKAKKGLTTIEEILRVSKSENQTENM